MSSVPIFGVVTVNRTSRLVPGVIPPSSTLQKLAGRSSVRTTQWSRRTSDLTIRFAPPVGGAASTEVKAISFLSCGIRAADTPITSESSNRILFFNGLSSLVLECTSGLNLELFVKARAGIYITVQNLNQTD